MGLPRQKPYFTVDQYLTLERKAEDRHEFLDGEIYAMAGESYNHGVISVNIVISLGAQLKGKPCHPLTKDTKVRSGPEPFDSRKTRGLFSYPDIVLICDEPKYHDDHKDVLTNPTAIIEVLSPQTEAFDRGTKFIRFQKWNPTLSDYLLVSQDQFQIEHFIRQSGGPWTYEIHDGLESTIVIDSLECELSLTDVYDRITLSDESA